MSTDITPPTLIENRTRGHHRWRIDELYKYRFWGEAATLIHENDKYYVPNVDDEVIDWEQGVYRVVEVDYTTGVSVLQRWQEPRRDENATDVDFLLGTSPSHPSEAFRIYLDTSVTPFTLNVDRTYCVYGDDVAYAKIFRGQNISETAEAIGLFYDAGGHLLGNQIPLELTGYRNDNTSIKRIRTAHTTLRLNDGEPLTVVFYGATGVRLSFATLLVHNTSVVHSGSPDDKYVTSITLESPFLSAADDTLIEYPINMPVENLNLVGVVHYSDRTTMRRPVDGTKFEMYGLQEFIATTQEQRVPLVLNYVLEPNEFSYILNPSPNRSIQKRYWAKTLRNDAAYSIKLFAYPAWQDAATGYRLEFFLANLERGEIYTVTNLVQLQTGSRAFDPTLYGVVQRIGFALDLNRVDQRFQTYRHVQSLEVTLMAPGTVTDRTPWTIGYTPHGRIVYGNNVHAMFRSINTNNWEFDLTSGYSTKAEWLENVFYNTQPLFDGNTEERAPEPNYFRLYVGSHSVEVPIDMWNTVITSHEGVVHGANVYLEFFRRTPTTDLYLGITGMHCIPRQMATS